MAIWTVNEGGTKVASIIVGTVRRPVPGDSRLVRIELTDGRTITASPRHPTFAGRPLGSYLVGELLDSVAVVALEYVPLLEEAATYDVLPAGATGVYWANGIPLESTLMPVEPARATLQ